METVKVYTKRLGNVDFGLSETSFIGVVILDKYTIKSTILSKLQREARLSFEQLYDLEKIFNQATTYQKALDEAVSSGIIERWTN